MLLCQGRSGIYQLTQNLISFKPWKLLNNSLDNTESEPNVVYFQTWYFIFCWRNWIRALCCKCFTKLKQRLNLKWNWLLLLLHLLSFFVQIIYFIHVMCFLANIYFDVFLCFFCNCDRLFCECYCYTEIISVVAFGNSGWKF